MIIPHHHHWELKKAERLFLAEAVAKRAETITAESQTPEVMDVDLNEKLATLELDHGEETYRVTIKKMVDKISDPQHKQSILEDSVKRYMRFYQIKIEEFQNNTEALENRFKETVEVIESRTQKELDILKTTIKEQSELREAETKTPPPLNEAKEISHHFGAYIKQLNARYFEARLEPVNQQSKYQEEASHFKRKISQWAQARIKGIQEKNGNTNDLKQLKLEIHQVYQNIASFDKQPAHISQLDLTLMSGQMKPELSKMDAFLDQDDKNLEARMEAERLNDPEKWEMVAESHAAIIIDMVEEEGLEDKFTELVKAKEDRSVMRYKKAKKVFIEEVKRQGKISVEAARIYTENFNRELFKPFIESELQANEEYKDSTFKVQISRQLDHLLSGETIPKTKTDKVLVNFIRGNRRQREEILRQRSQRQLLMRAIAQSTHPEGYQKEFKRYHIGKKTSTTGDLSKPSGHDKAARLKALMILGGQAKAIVTHYEPRATDEIEAINPEKQKIELGLDFEVSGIKNTRFRSALERGGFNMRDLALKGMKIMGAITVLTNVVGAFNSQEARDEESLVGRIGKAFEISVTNPALALGVGATVLGHKAEKDPRYIRYLWLSPHEKADVRTADKLDQIAGKVKRERLNRLTQNHDEWKVMERLDQKKVSKLNRLASQKRREDFKAKRPQKKVGISPDMLVEAGVLDPQKDKALIQGMGKGLNRTRYLFYNYFLNEKNFNIYNIKNHCTGSSFIE